MHGTEYPSPPCRKIAGINKLHEFPSKLLSPLNLEGKTLHTKNLACAAELIRPQSEAVAARSMAFREGGRAAPKTHAKTAA
jgi:hypothetical protein